MSDSSKQDYSLIGPSSAKAEEEGLAAAEWYHTEVPRKRMKELMRRRDAPALRDTAIWIGLLVGFGVGAYAFWGSWLCIPFFICYGVVYASAADARWHEAGHGTAFRTQWLNDALYQLSAFMVMKEPTFWRWSHARHHTDTIIVGRDREIIAMRPPDLLRLVVDVFTIRAAALNLVGIARHALGQLTPEERSFIPYSEQRRIKWEARVWICVYLLVIGAAIYLGSLLPLLFVGPIPTIYGYWLGYLFGLTQHSGLAENVLDHRLNTRTLYMSRPMRFIFWNMNYHLEHHMFPMVPYHALPELHKEIRSDLPEPYRGMRAAYVELVPALMQQWRQPGYYVERRLPSSAKPFRPELHEAVFEK